MQQQSDLDFINLARILNLPDATLPQQPATFAQLLASIEAIKWKFSVRVRATGNINLASPGATIDATAMVAGERFLAPLQTAGAENGIYIWNGAAVPATRSLDANTWNELENAVVGVEEGTSANTTFRQTAVNGTLGVTTISWGSFGTSAPPANETTAGIAEVGTQAETDAGLLDTVFITPLKLANWAGRKLKYEIPFGDGSAITYVITHGLGTRAVIPRVYRNSGIYDEVGCDIEHTSTTTITLKFLLAPTLNQYNVVVMG